MQEIIQGAAVAFFLKVLGTGFNFLFCIVLARTLNTEGVGLFFLSLTIITIASVLSRLGLDNAVLRFTSTNSAEGNWLTVKGLYNKAMLMILCSSLFVIGILWISAPVLANNIFHEPRLISPLRWMAFMVLPHAFFWIQAEFLRGIKKISFSQFIQGTSLPMLALTGLWLWRDSVTANGIVAIYSISAILTAVIGYISWKRLTPKIQKLTDKAIFPTSKLFGSSIPLYISAIMDLIIIWAATIFLGVWGTSSEVGIYSVAQRTATLISFVLFAINSVSAPKFATLYKQGDLKGLEKTARHSAKLMLLAASPALILFTIKPQFVMSLFGQDFTSGANLLIILSIGQFINVATGSVGYILMMTANEKLFRNCQILIAFLCITLCIILIPKYGATGAAISTAITIASSNILISFYVFKKLKITIIQLPFKTV